MSISFLKVVENTIRDTKCQVTDKELIALVKVAVDCLGDRRKLRKMNEIVVEAMAYEDAPVD